MLKEAQRNGRARRGKKKPRSEKRTKYARTSRWWSYVLLDWEEEEEEAEDLEEEVLVRNPSAISTSSSVGG